MTRLPPDAVLLPSFCSTMRLGSSTRAANAQVLAGCAPMLTDTGVDAPALSVPTFANPPTWVVPQKNFAVVGIEVTDVPMLLTIAVNMTGVISVKRKVENDTAEMVRSGFGPGTPMMMTSATWPPGAPVLAVKVSRSCAASGAVAGTVVVTLLSLPAGLAPGVNCRLPEATSVLKAPPAWSRPSMNQVWLRGAQTGSGLGLHGDRADAVVSTQAEW